MFGIISLVNKRRKQYGESERFPEKQGLQMGMAFFKTYTKESTIKELRSLGYEILSLCDCKHIPIGVNNRLRRLGASAHKTRGIKFNKECLNKWLLLHEISHIINMQKFGNKHDEHGENFMGIYNDLLVRYMDFTLVGLHRVQRIMDVRFNPYLPFDVPELEAV